MEGFKYLPLVTPETGVGLRGKSRIPNVQSNSFLHLEEHYGKTR